MGSSRLFWAAQSKRVMLGSRLILLSHHNLMCICWLFIARQVIAQRLSKLGTFKKTGAPGRLPAEVLIKRRKRGRNGEVSWEVVRARGHLDEVLEMRKGGTKLGGWIPAVWYFTAQGILTEQCYPLSSHWDHLTALRSAGLCLIL